MKKERDVDIGMDGYCCGICHDGSKPNWKNEILKEKMRTTEAFMGSQKTAGMNVFRERYLGIMQNKGREDFEVDCSESN